MKITKPKSATSSRTFEQVTPSEFKKAFKAARAGAPSDLYTILDWFLKLDGHTEGMLGQRISAITGSDYSLTADDQSTSADQQMKTIRDMFDRMDFISFTEELLKGDFYGIRAIELEWKAGDFDGGKFVYPSGFKIIPHHYIYAQKRTKDSDYTELYIGNAPADKYSPAHVVVWKSGIWPSYQDVDFTVLGKGLKTARWNIFKYFSVEDWAEFNEVFGMPMILGIAKPGADVDRLESAVSEMASASRGVIDDMSDMKLLESASSSTTGVNTFEAFKKVADAEISEALVGHALNGADGQTGTYGAMQTANGTKYDVAIAVALRLDRIIQTAIIDEIYRRNWPSSVTPVFKTNIKKVDNLKDLVYVDKTLNDMGLPMSKKALRAKYGVQEPDPKDQEDILTRVTANIFG